ncbi:MAG: transcriptional regulator TetR family [Herbinix sp.]|jgi:AcrR family transcriptional regulator|nr:transcriptional regulator TetR family [Herbinix sp.]
MDDMILHRKERLIITAIEIIDELGIQSLSTREIAKRQGISEATLFRHFLNKNELLAAILRFFAQFDDDIYQTTKLKQLNPKEAFMFFMTSYAEYYENYPAITSIMQIYEFLRYEPGLEDVIRDITEKRYRYVRSLLEDMKQANIVRVQADIDIITDLIVGYMRDICLKWRMSKFEFSVRQKIISTMEYLIESM